MNFELTPITLPGSLWRDPPKVDPDVRVLAVGDVHGRADLLCEIIHLFCEVSLCQLPPAKTEKLILLGDLIDRGPASDTVLRCLYAVRNDPGIIVLKGNHEAMLLACLDGKVSPHDGWLDYGADTFLQSLGLDVPDPREPDEVFAQRLHAALGDETVAWLRGLGTSHEEGDFFFCHAGVRPGVPLHKQSERDLMWIQSPFINSRRYHGKMVVHGHSIVPAICIQPNRIGVDTGAYLNGTLTGLLLQGEQAWSLTVRAEE